MPVHYARGGVFLIMVVDGDFTLDELKRSLDRALADPGIATPTRVLLDLAGAASMAGKSDGDLRDAAAHFAGNGDRLDRVALLMAGDLVDDLMRMGTAFVSQGGIRASVFRTRRDAEEWLRSPT